MSTTNEDDYTSHLLVQGSGHLVTFDRTPPRRVKKKPIGFNAEFTPKAKPRPRKR